MHLFYITIYIAICAYLSVLHAAIECPPLSLIDNGMIIYSPDDTANYELGTVATYVCSSGFRLDFSQGGSETRTCVDDMDNDAEGVFDRLPPRCVRK